jgi:hypothetical protein
MEVCYKVVGDQCPEDWRRGARSGGIIAVGSDDSLSVAITASLRAALIYAAPTTREAA